MNKELEALEEIKWLETKCYVESPQDEKFEDCIKIIKQVIIKAQEQEKVLEIIWKKDVNIASLKEYDLEEYNMVFENKLTEEEFDLLKRYFK